MTFISETQNEFHKLKNNAVTGNFINYLLNEFNLILLVFNFSTRYIFLLFWEENS